jgi:hypothetical protein
VFGTVFASLQDNRVKAFADSQYVWSAERTEQIIMKKLITAGIAALTLFGCGALLDSLEQLRASLEKGSVNKLAHDISSGLLDVQDLTGGLQGLAPKLGQAGAGVGRAPSFASAPGLQFVLTEHQCTEAQLGKTVTVSFQKTDYPQSAEEKSAGIVVTQHCKDLEGIRVLVSSRVEADILYKDGGTGTMLVVEYADETTDSNVLTGNTYLTAKRYFPEGDKRVSIALEAIVDTGGDWDNPPRDKTWSWGKFTLSMSDGTLAVVEVQPDEPIIDGEEMVKGTASRIVTHAAGPVTMTTEKAVLTDVDVGVYDLVRYYRDGAVDTVHVEADGQKLTLVAQGRDGFTREGEVDLITGVYAVVTIFPAGHAIEKVEESGTWRRRAPTGTYLRVVTFVSGRTTRLDMASIQISGKSLNASFTYHDTQGPVELTGVLEIKRNDSATLVNLILINAAGDQAKFEQVHYADGSSVQKYEKDIQATAQNPDETGVFSFAVDGSGSGTVVVYKDDGATVTYQVTIIGNTSVNVLEEN